MITDPTLNVLVDKAKDMPSKEENWPLFIEALEECGYDSDKPMGQGDPGSLARIISIDLGPTKDGNVSITRLFEGWDYTYKKDLERRVKQRYLDATVQVTYFNKSGKPGKPERIPKEDADKPWKPGCTIEEENARIEGRGWDSDHGATFTLRQHSP
jgi:hypothetical protein